MATGPFDNRVIQHLLECPVCLNKFRNHRALACQHIFCQDCLVPLVRSGRLSCPVCRDERTRVGPSGLSGLPRSVMFMQILEFYCARCFQSKKEIHCRHCSKWLCDTCHAVCKVLEELEEMSDEQIAADLRALKEIERSKVKMKRQMSEICGEIDELAEEVALTGLSGYVNDLESIILDELHSEMDKDISHLDILTKDVNARINELRLFKRQNESLKSTENEEDDTDSMCENWKFCLSKAKKESTVCRKFTFLPERNIQVGENACLGTLMIEPSADYKAGDMAVEEIGCLGSGQGQFQFPSRVAMSPITGDIYVVERNRNRVQVFHENGHYTCMYEIGDPEDDDVPEGLLRLSPHAGLTPAAYSSASPGRGVAITDDCCVITYDAKSQVVTTILDDMDDQRQVDLGDMWRSPYIEYPSGIAYHQGNIYMCDGKHSRILVMGQDCVVARVVKTSHFQPEDVAVASDGRIFTVGHTDHLTGELRVYSPAGCHLSTPVSQASGSVTLVWPLGVALAEDDHVIVTDGYTNQVHIFDVDGAVVRTFGSLGTELGEFNMPCGVVCTNDGRVIVVDTLNHRFQIFTFK